MISESWSIDITIAVFQRYVRIWADVLYTKPLWPPMRNRHNLIFDYQILGFWYLFNTVFYVRKDAPKRTILSIFIKKIIQRESLTPHSIGEQAQHYFGLPNLRFLVSFLQSVALKQVGNKTNRAFLRIIIKKKLREAAFTPHTTAENGPSIISDCQI